MCLIVVAWRLNEQAPLIAAANRDEYYDRPAAAATWWTDHPDVYAGRDLRSGGTWLGINRAGRFAALTNIRAPNALKPDAPSRGNLVADFLTGKASPQEYVAQIARTAHRFSGFNLLVSDSKELIWFSNAETEDARNGQPLPPGCYGLSNALLDVAWPKVVKTKAQFESLLKQNAPDEAYFEMLADVDPAPDSDLPRTGVSLEREKLLSSIRIVSPDYGTRVSTVVRFEKNRAPVLNEVLIC